MYTLWENCQKSILGQLSPCEYIGLTTQYTTLYVSGFFVYYCLTISHCIGSLLVTFASLITFKLMCLLFDSYIKQLLYLPNTDPLDQKMLQTNIFMGAQQHANIYQTVRQTQCHIFLKTHRNHALLIKLATAVKFQEQHMLSSILLSVVANHSKHA